MAPRYDARAHNVAQMKTHVRVAAAALIVLGVTTACQQTTEGTVAMTTEPGPPIPSATGTPGRAGYAGNARTAGPAGDSDPEPAVAGQHRCPRGPGTAQCADHDVQEFSDLDEATRLAVIREILKQDDNPLGPDGESVGQMLVEAACQFLPDATVNEVLLGGGPP